MRGVLKAILEAQDFQEDRKGPMGVLEKRGPRARMGARGTREIQATLGIQVCQDTRVGSGPYTGFKVPYDNIL